MDIRVSDDPSSDAARWLARRLRDAVRRRGTATLCVSGGSTAPPLFVALLGERVPWTELEVWQVDERVAPDGDPDRNAEQLAGFRCPVHLMPVTAVDVDRAAGRYAANLPDRFDVVHLGLGDDGHTASWPPKSDVVDSRRMVEVIGPFNGRQRMTLTPVAVNVARSCLMLCPGRSKAPLIERWLLRDPSLPVDHVRRSDTIVFVDPAAASRLPM